MDRKARYAVNSPVNKNTNSVDRRRREREAGDSGISVSGLEAPTRPPSSSRKSPAPQPDSYNSVDRKAYRQQPPSSTHNKSFDVGELRHRTPSQTSDVFLPPVPPKGIIPQVGSNFSVFHLSPSICNVNPRKSLFCILIFLCIFEQ